MKLDIKHKEVIVNPAEYTVRFDEGNIYNDYIKNENWDTFLSDELNTWLAANDPACRIVFDKGDFGDGPAWVIIHFTEEKHAVAFKEKFKRIPCNAPDQLSCENLKQDKINKEFYCDECGFKVNYR